MAMSRKKVLWVDDEIEYLRSHIMFLETRGYSVTPVFSGDDAIHLIEQKPDEFDIVLLDEQMPGKGGLATLSEIKEMTPELPVVMVTKSEEEQLMEEALGRNIDGYLTKPVNPSQILIVCKRLLHSKELMSTQLKQDFVRNFSQNREILQNKMDIKEWVALYKNFAKWDIELEDVRDEGIRQAHTGQKSDANAHFSDFIIAHYMQWMQGDGKAPLFSPQVIDTYVVPHLHSDERVCFVVVDSMRMDQFIMLQTLLKKYFFIENNTYFSILPNAAEFARNALFAGMYPSEIQEKRPKVWADILSDDKNRNKHESALLKYNLKSHKFKGKDLLEYRHLADESDAQDIIDNYDKCKNKKLVTLVVDFLDKFIRGQSASNVLQDIVPDDKAFRKLFYTWFERSKLFEMLQMLSEKDCTVVLTTSGGTNLCTRGTESYGGPCVFESLRYRSGEKITCDERYAFYMHEPERFNLPQETEESNFIILKENYYFINHDTYHNYNEQYQNTFQRGGISMEEMIVPLAVMKPKQIKL